MLWLLWLLLCLGPPGILYYKGREPQLFLVVAIGLSGGLFLIGWGFMILTGARDSMAALAGQLFALVGLVAAYILAVMASPSESGGKGWFSRREKELQCPNCAGFVTKADIRCPYCNESLS